VLTSQALHVPDDGDELPTPSDEDIRRVRATLSTIGGKNVDWGAHQILDVLVVEHRMRSERLASERLMRATWVLAGATIVLAIATVVLIFATLAE
jgi:hypothetical protein